MTWLAWFPETALKGAVLLAVAWLATRLLQKQPAALRHLVWTAALGGLLVMPALSATTPVRLALPARQVATAADNTAQSELKAAERGTAQETETARGTGDGVPGTGESPRSNAALTNSTSSSSIASILPSWSFAQWAIALWLLGAIALSVRFLAGVIATRRLGAHTSNADDHLHSALDSAAARVGLRTTPQLVVTDSIAMPCAFGVLQPVIVLPESAREWSRERLDVVLLHEASHVRRGDYVTHVVAEVARILHWYNPLVWVASRSLRNEAERATDERVINAGAMASDYAGHLLDIVRGAGAQRIPAPLLPLAARSEFEGRLLAILEYAGSPQLRARTAAVTLAVAAGLVGTVASISAAVPPNSPIDPVSTVVAGPDRSGPMRSTTTPNASAPRRRSSQVASESSLQALLATINDPVPAVRLAVVRSLTPTRDTVVVRALMQVLLQDDNAEVRRAAASSLGEIGDALAVSALSDALLKDRDTEVRREAASALGSIENERGASALAQALESDTDLEVRINSAQALGQIEGQTATDALGRALTRASDAKLKIAVIEALDNVDDSRTVAAIVAALRDAHPGVRHAAAHALDGVDDSSVLPALIAAARDSDIEVRRAVIDALNDHDDERLVDVFANALTDSDAEIRAAAASGLGNIEDLRTAPRQLIAALDDANADVRHEVAHALGHIHDPSSLSALIARATDPVVEVRQAVVESLREFPDATATAALQRALRDTDADVRAMAAEALGDRRRK
ncbi:MAG TPA: HEAT repeat domain-containing protein [Gemmatimonadaceae bacterium]|nr:HEAT repeat domain-containing protein [Gemmatimonadaceae bacterium]